MKIEIDNEGFLCLERGGVLKEQYCPHCHGVMDQCGDWCPLFSEPFKNGYQDQIVIHLCNGKSITQKWEDYTDRRTHNAVL